jgi:predicted small secreted protein
MITCIKRIFVLLFVAALLAIVGAACNTAHGFGEDVKDAGQGIEDGTK